MSPDIEVIFALYHRFPFAAFTVETNQFQELLAQQILQRGQELGYLLPLFPVNNTRDKLKRIQGLQPLVKHGGIMFHRSQQQLLEQMRFFPKGKYDDGLDALEMAVRGITSSEVEHVEYCHWNPETEQIEPGLPESPPPADIDWGY